MLEFAESMPHRELRLIAHSRANVQAELTRFNDDQSVDEYVDLLQKVLSILLVLSQDPRVTQAQTSVLWHTDLHLGNIFVSHEDLTLISGIIDWQSAQAAPTLIQARFPEFLQPPKNYIPGATAPSLPDNFDELDADEKAKATEENELASQSKYYEMSCLAYNKHVYDAMKLDRRLWEPFTCSQLSSGGSLVPLRNSLVRIFLDWHILGLPGHCPFKFTEEELRRHHDQVQRYEDRKYLWDIAKFQLCTDDSGWVQVDRWEMTNKMNEYLFDMYIETLSEELSPQGAAKQWPFPPKGV